MMQAGKQESGFWSRLTGPFHLQSTSGQRCRPWYHLSKGARSKPVSCGYNLYYMWLPQLYWIKCLNCDWQKIESESQWHRLVWKDEPWPVQEAAAFLLGKRRWDGRADFVAISTSSSVCGGWAESEKAVSKPICWSKDWYASTYWSTLWRWQEENEIFASRIQHRPWPTSRREHTPGIKKTTASSVGEV